MLKNDISEQLADLFDLSFTTGTFPTLLKTAKILPIHKKDSKSNLTNYRLIFLLSNLNKILEKLMHSMLSTFLNIKDIIYPLQFGFRQSYSTSYVLIHLTENIQEALDQGKYGCGIFVDLQKAFADDTNLLHINDSIKKLNKAVNSDLRNLTNWLNANKISLNVSKTELIL